MIQRTTEAKLKDAYKLLRKHGVYLCVPGWFDIQSADDLIRFCDDKNRWYESKRTGHGP